MAIARALKSLGLQVALKHLTRALGAESCTPFTAEPSLPATYLRVKPHSELHVIKEALLFGVDQIVALRNQIMYFSLRVLFVAP